MFKLRLPTRSRTLPKVLVLVAACLGADCKDATGPASASRPIYFMQLTDDWHLYRVGLDSAAPELVPMPLLGNELHPAVSHDGEDVAFIRGTPNLAIYGWRSGATYLQVLYDGGATHIAWSPSGTRLALTIPPVIRIVPVPSGPAYDVALNLTSANWSPDEKKLIAAAADGHHLVVLTLATGHVPGCRGTDHRPRARLVA